MNSAFSWFYSGTSAAATGPPDDCRLYSCSTTIVTIVYASVVAGSSCLWPACCGGQQKTVDAASTPGEGQGAASSHRESTEGARVQGKAAEWQTGGATLARSMKAA